MNSLEHITISALIDIIRDEGKPSDHRGMDVGARAWLTPGECYAIRKTIEAMETDLYGKPSALTDEIREKLLQSERPLQ